MKKCGMCDGPEHAGACPQHCSTCGAPQHLERCSIENALSAVRGMSRTIEELQAMLRTVHGVHFEALILAGDVMADILRHHNLGIDNVVAWEEVKSGEGP